MKLQYFVKQKRLAKGISARKLSDKIGASSGYISLLENGKIEMPGEEVLLAIFRELEISNNEYQDYLNVVDLGEFTIDLRKDSGIKREKYLEEIRKELEALELDHVTGLRMILKHYRNFLKDVTNYGEEPLKEFKRFMQFIEFQELEKENQ
jgi:transcriptional regulator with XRE-family HTH domain